MNAQQKREMMFTAPTRKAVVTGGSSGIGKSITKRFLESGFKTVIADRISPAEDPTHYFSVDLTRTDEIREFIVNVKKAIGTPDILICNAGRGVHEKLTEGNPELWEEIFRLNVFSTFRLIRAFVPDMQKLDSADVVFISSVSSGHPHPYGGIYTATKAAIDQIAETLRIEVQPDVRVTVIRPGVVETDFFKNMASGTHTPEDIGWGAIDPDYIADAVLFAVSQPESVMLNDLVIRPIAQPM